MSGLLGSCVTAQSSALKPIDLAALQAAVDATAMELLVPGAVVVLATRKDKVSVSNRTTMVLVCVAALIYLAARLVSRSIARILRFKHPTKFLAKVVPGTPLRSLYN